MTVSAIDVSLTLASTPGRLDGRLLRALVVDALRDCDDEAERIAALVRLVGYLVHAADDPEELLQRVVRAVAEERGGTS